MKFRDLIISLGLVASLVGCSKERTAKTEMENYKVMRLDSDGGLFRRHEPYVSLDIDKRGITLGKSQKTSPLSFLHYNDSNKDGHVDNASGYLQAPDGSYFEGNLNREKDFEKYPDFFEFFDKDFNAEVEGFRLTLQQYRVWSIFTGIQAENNKK